MSVKNKVPQRCWYYLLDFNDNDNFETINKKYNKKGLHELSIEQFWELFYIASNKDLEILQK